LQLSVIQSSAITLQRRSQEPCLMSQDAYFAVVLMSGQYQMMQNGREVYLQPGDITVYDATLAHQIQCPVDFTKLIVAIPRALFREHLAGIESCTALRIPGSTGTGLIASYFLRTLAGQTRCLNSQEFAALSEQALDLLTMAVTSVRPSNYNLSRSRVLAVNRLKAFIEQNLKKTELDTAMICHFSGLSARYINNLFASENTSLMRYVWRRRLEMSHKDILNSLFAGRQLSEIAFRWGFNDYSHFSRAFKQQFGCSPRALKHAETLRNK
jgi:AraC family transcriptional activator of tynA and feaB